MDRALFSRTDLMLLAVVLLLCAYGALMIYSCTQAQLAMADKPPTRTVSLQLTWIFVGLVVMLLVMMVDYNRLPSLSLFIYGLAVVLLLLVLAIGPLAYGSARRLSLGALSLQPGELAKLAVVVILGTYLASRTHSEQQSFETLLRSLLYVLVPSALLFLQPDLGTPVVLVFIWFFVLFLAGAKLSHLAAFAFALMMLFATAWGSDIIRPYHKERLTAFMHPQDERQGAGWQIQQSLIAIGSGHFLGKGLYQGTQSRLAFIAHQEKDFIFTVVGEEWGFVGSTVMLGLLAMLMWRSLAISWEAKDILGRLLAAGVAAMFLIHIVANIGMTLGMAPVKGMTLPFVSYGGSSMVANFAAIGILQSIHIRKRKIAF